MRKVFDPPKVETGWLRTIIGALLLTFGVFMVLPLTQMVSAKKGDSLELKEMSIAEPPPPPPEIEEEEEEEEEQEPPPPMDMQQDTAPPDIPLPSLDGFAGGAGVLDLGNFDEVAEGLSDDAIGIFDVSDLDNKPQPIAQIAPRHPRELQKQRIEGSVVLLFVVNEQGMVVDPRVERASRKEFEQAALEAVRKWKYKPGMREGEPVKTYIRQPIKFSISS